MNEIHAHEVLSMMIASGKSYTKTSLRDEITNNFGADARFYTCSSENLTATQLVDFLDSKGKFIPADGGFGTSPDVMCRH
ncbi:MAG TPA: YecH family metal-binding protein [Verrucomicrobiae bacterium]